MDKEKLKLIKFRNYIDSHLFDLFQTEDFGKTLTREIGDLYDLRDRVSDKIQLIERNEVKRRQWKDYHRKRNERTY